MFAVSDQLSFGLSPLANSELARAAEPAADLYYPGLRSARDREPWQVVPTRITERSARRGLLLPERVTNVLASVLGLLADLLGRPGSAFSLPLSLQIRIIGRAARSRLAAALCHLQPIAQFVQETQCHHLPPPTYPRIGRACSLAINCTA
jgi:hypothetical protein